MQNSYSQIPEPVRKRLETLVDRGEHRQALTHLRGVTAWSVAEAERWLEKNLAKYELRHPPALRLIRTEPEPLAETEVAPDRSGPLSPEEWRQANKAACAALSRDPSLLETYNIDWLRKYASHVLGMPRASKIPGGKPVLIRHIREWRRQAS